MSIDLFKLHGRVAVVIGGARDLGYDMAEALSDAGANVMITSRSQDHADEAARRLNARSGYDACGEALDIRNYAAIEVIAEKAFAWKGHVDILVVNAGGTPSASPGPLFDREPSDIEELIALT